VTQEAQEQVASMQMQASPRKGWLRSILIVLGTAKTGVLVAALIGALALNVATLTSVAAFNLLSSAVVAIAGSITSKPVTVRSRHAAQLDTLKNKHNKDISSIRRQNQKLLADQRKLKKTVKTTTNRVSRRIAKATARSTGSMAAESIPYIGIGAIIAVTGWEVHDACETMKDLHELDLAFDPDSANDEEHTEVCGQRVPTKTEIIDSLKKSPSVAWARAKNLVSSAPGLPDLPSWNETVRSARAAWYRVAEFIESMLRL